MAIRAVLFDVGRPIDCEREHERLIDPDIRACLSAAGAPVDGACRAAVAAFAPNACRAMIWLPRDNQDESQRQSG